MINADDLCEWRFLIQLKFNLSPRQDNVIVNKELLKAWITGFVDKKTLVPLIYREINYIKQLRMAVHLLNKRRQETRSWR